MSDPVRITNADDNCAHGCICADLHGGVGSMKEKNSGTLHVQCMEECNPTVK